MESHAINGTWFNGAASTQGITPLSDMQAPKVPFVSLAEPFTPSGNTILVTGGASGAHQLIVLVSLLLR